MSIKFKQKEDHRTGRDIPDCWISDCYYTVARCKTGEDSVMYQITAPRGGKPFAYTPNRREVKKIIAVHKKEQERDS